MSIPTASRRRSTGPDRPYQLSGLGIKDFPSMQGGGTIDGKPDAEQEVVVPALLGQDLRAINETPSPKTRYSPRVANGSSFQTPPSPGMLYPSAQHGSSLSKFKSQSQVPSSPRIPYDAHNPSTPTPRMGSFGSTPGASFSSDCSTGSPGRTPYSRRPTLLRTPPTDHPTGEITHLTGDEDEDDREPHEEEDSVLPDLPMSPARFAFTNQFAKPDPTLHDSIANVFSSDPFNDEAVLKPLSTPRTTLPHTRNQSIGEPRVHARNLSLFFPQPGAEPIRPPGSPRSGELEAPVTDISRQGRRKVGLGANGSFSFGSANQVPQAPSSPGPKVVGRRGHHHKHSLSHNFFSFLDPTVTNPHLAKIPVDDPVSIPNSATPRPMATTHVGGARSSATLAAPILTPLLPSPISNNKPSRSWLIQIFSLQPAAQLTLGFGILEFFLGASIWVEGQAMGSVGLTGLGYLVVFDALGVWVRLWGEVLRTGEGSTSTAERPFGSHRKESLLYFVQSIFLLFSALYIAKDALEIALMSGAGSEGGHGHGHGHGHSHANNPSENGQHLPILLLTFAAASTVLSGSVLQNHSKLVEAVGPSIMPLTRSSSKHVRKSRFGKSVDILESFLANPFSLGIVSCISIFLLGNVGLSANQMPKLERIMAFVEAAVAFWLAYPSSLIFGQVLLQTAPPEQTVQMLAFKKAIGDIKDHPSVLRTSAPHIWQLTPHDSSDLVSSHTPRSTPLQSRRSSFDGSACPVSPRRPARSATGIRTLSSNTNQMSVLVADLTVWVKDDLGDRSILDLTRYCYERCSEAVRAKHGRTTVFGANDSAGEVTITVKREKELSEQAALLDKAHGHRHDHHHHHHHHHDHDHEHHDKHEHSHSHESHNCKHHH